jgi:formate-nitrite transporter family protein
MLEDASTSTGSRKPLVSYRAMFQAELEQATDELQRPAFALLASGIIAGAAVGISLLLLVSLASADGAIPEGIAARILFGSAYAVGFILAILGRTDLFTEYTTIAIFPVITGDSSMTKLARLWGLVYAGNLLGGFVLAMLAVVLGPAMGIGETAAFGLLAQHLTAYDWWVVLLSAALAGWLMGLLSWLIAGGRDTISQILFIWLIGMTIGALGLHHAITGAVEMFAGAMTDPGVSGRDVGYFLILVTFGNACGGVLFAVLVHQGVRMQAGAKQPRHDQDEGRQARRRRG